MKKKCSSIDPYCTECSGDNKYCTKCKNNYHLYQNKCYEIKDGFMQGKNFRACKSYMTGCSLCITDKVCTKCNYGYVLEFDTKKCRRPAALEKKYYYDPKDDTYKKCDYKIPNCLYCTNNGNDCYRCNSGYHIIENGENTPDNNRCYHNNDLTNKFLYYTKNDTHRVLCGTKKDGCKTCNTIGSICKSCKGGYKLNKSKDCELSGITNNCPATIGNCEKCTYNNCIQCSYGYTPDPKEKGKCFPIPSKNDYYYDNIEKTYIRCLDSPYLERCFSCKDAKTCLECDSKSHTLSNGKCIKTSY